MIDFVEPIYCSHILVKHKDSSNPINTRKQKDVTRTKEEAFKTAKMLMMSLSQGQGFDKIANAFSECPSGNQGGDLGPLPRGKMVKEFEDPAFALEVGQTSEPVETTFGVHIIHRRAA